MQERTIDLGTDVAAFFLFHPDDLVHRKNDPIAWYSYEFASRPESEARRWIAFYTGSDGGYKFRITEGDLTEAEKRAVAGSWEFGYIVGHGRVFLDNSDGLPGEEQMDTPDNLPDQWFTIANGAYRVTVHAIARAGESNPDALPDYVVRFEATDEANLPPTPPTPPELPPVKGATPRLSTGVPVEGRFANESNESLRPTYPSLVVPGEFLEPGFDKSLTISEALYAALDQDWGEALFGKEDHELILSPTPEIPTLATIVEVNGWSQMADSAPQMQVAGKQIVQVTGRTPGTVLERATVETVPRESSSLTESEIVALKEAFAEYTRTAPAFRESVPHATFEASRVAALTSGTVLTAYLIHLLPMPWEQRRSLVVASDTERARVLQELIKSRQ